MDGQTFLAIAARVLHINPARIGGSASVKHLPNQVIKSPYYPTEAQHQDQRSHSPPTPHPGVVPATPPPHTHTPRMLHNLLFPLRHPTPAGTSRNLLHANSARLVRVPMPSSVRQLCRYVDSRVWGGGGWRNEKAASTFPTAESGSGNTSVTTLVRRLMYVGLKKNPQTKKHVALNSTVVFCFCVL